MMNRRVFERMTHLLKQGSRVALLTLLLGAIGAFLLGSFASPAQAAASASPAVPGRATVEVRTIHANSFRVTEVTSSGNLTACYSLRHISRSRSPFLKGELSSLGTPVMYRLLHSLHKKKWRIDSFLLHRSVYIPT